MQKGYGRALSGLAANRSAAFMPAIVFCEAEEAKNPASVDGSATFVELRCAQ
jgi:hypothetical protein